MSGTRPGGGTSERAEVDRGDGAVGVRDVRDGDERGEVPDVWTGEGRVTPWPDVEVGAYYLVNKSASGNSTDREGEVGRAVEQSESGFGHKWATLDFPDGSRAAVRTVLLVPVEPQA